MSTQFEIVGQLKACKETESFKPFEVRDFPSSGWQTTKYKFNVVSGNNRFMVEISGGKWKDDKKNKILTYAKSENGKKGEKLEVKWEDRKNPDTIAKVAGYRIYTCNLLTFEEAKEIDEETAKKKDHKFLENTEYAALVKKVIDSGKYDEAKFKIVGNIEYQYSEKHDQFYRVLQVTKIYKVDSETPCKADVNIDAYYTESSFDDESYEETNKCFFNCYTDYYFSNVKARRFIPINLVLRGGDDEKSQKRVAGFKKKLTAFEDDSSVRKVSLVCDMIDGAETKEISYDDLDDETKELIDLGMMEESEAIKALGGNMYGDRVQEYRIKSFGRGSVKGTDPTDFEIEDLLKKPIAEEESAEDDSDDLFDDDDDI